MPPSRTDSRRAIHFVMLAVLVWGVILSIGVYYRWKRWQGCALVLACTLVFIGGWKLLLVFRRPPDGHD